MSFLTIWVPLINGALGIYLGKLTGLELGGATLLGVLTAGATYIAAPAAIRMSLPYANPTLYLTSSLAITFPFTITLGIPLCPEIARRLYSGSINLHPMKLVTIVCDAYAQEPVTNLSRDAGTYGWTLFAIEGDGSKGPRPNDIREFANIQQGGGAAGRRGEKVSRTIG